MHAKETVARNPAGTTHGQDFYPIHIQVLHLLLKIDQSGIAASDTPPR